MKELILIILLFISLFLILTLSYIIHKKSKIKKISEEKNEDYSDLFEDIKKKKTKKHLNS